MSIINIFYLIFKSLGFEKFSVIGWSDGGIAGLVLAINYPTNVKSIIMWGSIGFPSEKLFKLSFTSRDLDYWSRERIDNYLKIYDNRNEIQELWNRHMNFVVNYRKYFPEGVFKNKFRSIQCPVLIMHGDKV
jgi:valacyclovir hydrolase